MTVRASATPVIRYQPGVAGPAAATLHRLQDAELGAKRTQRVVLVFEHRLVGDATQVDLRQDAARREEAVGLVVQAEDPKSPCLEDPDLADAKASIDVKLVDRPVGHHDLEGDIGDRAVAAAAITFIGSRPRSLSSVRNVVEP